MYSRIKADPVHCQNEYMVENKKIAKNVNKNVSHNFFSTKQLIFNLSDNADFGATILINTDAKPIIRMKSVNVTIIGD